jgi:hypothetical protein
MNLRTYQEELKKLIFPHDPEATDSMLWGKDIPKRLNVYRNNTRTNWSDTLDHDFELTRSQFEREEWNSLKQRFFIDHPPQHWELNTSMGPFLKFIGNQKVAPFVKELADYEWSDLKIFIDRSVVRKGSGLSNPTLLIRVYQHQIFDWVERRAPSGHPPKQKPEVLIFYRDSKNTCHIQEADPLMLLMIDHFKTPGSILYELEHARQKLLPNNTVPLDRVFEELQKSEIIL